MRRLNECGITKVLTACFYRARGGREDCHPEWIRCQRRKKNLNFVWVGKVRPEVAKFCTFSEKRRMRKRRHLRSAEANFGLPRCSKPDFLPDYCVEHQSIVILDFGSQYTQLIARRLRELKVFSVVLPCTASIEEIKKYSPIGIILSGGPFSVYADDAPIADERVLALGKPVLGVCYGLHYITQKLGGVTRAGEKREDGHEEMTVSVPSKIFAGLPQSMSVWIV